MKILVLGAGKMSNGAVYDFLKNNHIEKITVVDQSEMALQKLADHFNDSRIKTFVCRADDYKSLQPFFSETDGTLSAVPYDYNPALTELAIQCGSHFVDLGGNTTAVAKQFKMDTAARTKSVGIIPDCGLAPGMVSVLTAHLINELARIDTVKIRVGELPVQPRTPLNYRLVFSVHGLINKYLEDALILEDGQIKTVPSMTEVEELEFPKPFGLLEAFYTSGGTSTLPQTYQDKISFLDYKTIRYPGHCHIMKAMLDLGFADNTMLEAEGGKLSKRDLFEEMLVQPLEYETEDVVLIRVTASGQKAGGRKTIQFQAIEYGDKKSGLTAMTRTTAFPAAAILQMLMENKITDRGVLYQEKSVPTNQFLEEMEKRNIIFDIID